MLGAKTPDPTSADLELAAAALGSGGLVVYPTETLYGLGADALKERALEGLARLKGRDAGKPVSVVIASREMLRELVASMPPPAERLIDAFWPGPLTIVFPAKPELPALLTGGRGTIGARVSSHPIARALVERLGRPITATSANPGGFSPALDVAEARRYFGSAVAAYVDGGRSPGGLGSTVIDCSTGRPTLVREGSVPRSGLERVLGTSVGR